MTGAHVSRPSQSVFIQDCGSSPAVVQEDDLNIIAAAWPDLPPVVKAGIMAMIRSAQSHR
jgi:hypothetical protein